MNNPRYVATSSEQSSSRHRHSVCGSGGGDAGAVFLFDDQRSGLLHAVPVCALEHARAAIGGRGVLGATQVHRWTTDVKRTERASMLTRREALGAIAGGVLVGKPSQPATAVNFAIPANACDCHTHIYGDPAKFPLWSGRVYTPEPALPEEMSALHRALHMRRVVIGTPSVYGTDN